MRFAEFSFGLLIHVFYCIEEMVIAAHRIATFSRCIVIPEFRYY